ncbi:hypothetical protein [Sodalis sp. RH20]|uniref:hypothetical protein n=1 Tax=unclassified Sodalis (in: enterobacteria) TaxID=2636512 RepID=UPI0039B3D590
MALPEPTVPQKKEGVVTGNDLAVAGGLIVIVPRYVTAGLGDYIDLVFNGTSVLQRIIMDLANEPPFSTIIPAYNVPNGNNTLFYTVTDTFNQTSTSPAAEVFITGNSQAPSPPLAMAVSTNAASIDYDAINVEPFNQGALVGRPTAQVNVTVSEPAFIYESHSQKYSFFLDQNGLGFFKVYSPRQVMIYLTAYETDRPDRVLHDTMIFGPYKIGNENIEAINFTTHAPANGRTQNSIYLQTRPQAGGIYITEIDVRVNGHAVIAGYNAQAATIALNSDNSVAINITDTYVERVTVILRLPQVAGGAFTLNTDFVAQPVPGIAAPGYVRDR